MSEEKTRSILQVRSRRWQITENNPTESLKDFAKRFKLVGGVKYVIGCEEVGENAGTRHFHYYVVFENAVRGSSLKEVFTRSHFETCVGSEEDNIRYITKQTGDKYEEGKRSEPVRTSGDLAQLVMGFMLEGETPLSIVQNHIECADYVVKNYRNLEEIFKHLRKR